MLGMEMMLKQMIGLSTEEMQALLEQGKSQLGALVNAMANIERNTTETLAIVRRIEERTNDGGRNNGSGGEPVALIRSDAAGLDGNPGDASGSLGGGTDGSDNG